jgi:putative peptide zinc metalloprotease protein
MSATADRPAAAATAQPVAPPAPLARAEGLELLGAVSGSGYRQGTALVRREDGQMVQLTPLMYALLGAVDGERGDAELAAAVTERLGRAVGPEHVARLAEKLREQGLLRGSESNAPPRLNPLLALRWKFLITDPAITRRITAPFTQLFRSWIVVPVLAGFAAVAWFVLVHKGVASAASQAFHSPELLLLVLALGVGSAAFHEIGHASALRFGRGRPGGMGAGIYLVWPAFYTDVTDAYRLPRGARLRTDLGGIYFNAIIAVVTLGVWALTRTDALLLLIGIQLLEMVKNLSPVIRSDGYHILSDATGVPDLYAHIGPTLRRLLPGRRAESSALTGRARALVTVWVLVVVPVLAAMSLTAILLFPKLAASTWESGSRIVSAIPRQAGDGDVLPLLASIVRVFALALPVVGTALMAGRLGRRTATRAWAWSAGRRDRRAIVALGAAGVAALLAWAWWPSGQYQPVRPTDAGTIQSVGRLVGARPAVVPVQEGVAVAAPPVRLTPGTHLAVAMIPAGGATKDRPAIFVIRDHRGGGKPAVVVSPDAPSTRETPRMQPGDGSAAAPAASAPAATATPAPSAAPPVPATAFPFILPDKPGPNDSQALATNSTDGGIRYDVVYSLVTVKGGDTVDEENSAYALASCKACKTVAVSFQLVLVVGQSNVIKPINVAEALNDNCPYCVTVAVADQIVVTVREQPSDELLRRLTDELRKLDAIEQLGGGVTPAAVAQAVVRVQQDIEQDLRDSGLLTDSGEPPGDTATATPSPAATATPSPSPSASPGSAATATATATPTPAATATPSATETPAAPTTTASPTATTTP